MTGQALAQIETEIDGIEAADKHAVGLSRLSEVIGKAAEGDLEFGFDFKGMTVSVRARAKNQKTNMKFAADLGAMPYTAEDAAARNSAVAILRSASRQLGGKIRVTADQRIVYYNDLYFDEPFSPVMLVSGATLFTVRVKPFVELIAGYVRPA